MRAAFVFGSMNRFDLAFPCTADFSRMKRVPGGRFCGDCNKVVHDLSAMSEEEANALLARTPRERVCVRYVYDAATQRVVFDVGDRTKVIPEHRLTSRLKRKLALAAALAAPMLVEACGGNDGGGFVNEPTMQEDAGRDANIAKPEAAVANDAGVDAPMDAPDAD